MRRFVHGLRTEGGGRGRETAAVIVGVFIGCQPLYGFHFALCWMFGWLFGLNRLKVYLAANISNPLVAPFLLFAELQTGSWLRRGAFHPLTLEAVRDSGVVAIGLDLLVGSLVIGTVLAIAAGWATYAAIGPDRGDPFAALVRRAADRYVASSVTAWEFARGKLTHDPIYRAALFDGLLSAPTDHRPPATHDRPLAIDDQPPSTDHRPPSTDHRPPSTGRRPPSTDHRPLATDHRPLATDHRPLATDQRPPSGPVLADIGCGQGLMLALLAEARRAQDAGERVLGRVPRFARMIGVETRPRVAAIAREALGADAEIVTADARTADLPDADVVLLFDVLHLMPADDQEALLQELERHLAPAGVLLVREADAGAGWKFRAVRLGNRLKAIAVGRPRQTFHFRTAADWVALLARHGLHAQARAMGQGTPFGNVLLSAQRVHETPARAASQDVVAVSQGRAAAPAR